MQPCFYTKLPTQEERKFPFFPSPFSYLTTYPYPLLLLDVVKWVLENYKSRSLWNTVRLVSELAYVCVRQRGSDAGSGGVFIVIWVNWVNEWFPAYIQLYTPNLRSISPQSIIVISVVFWELQFSMLNFSPQYSGIFGRS